MKGIKNDATILRNCVEIHSQYYNLLLLANVSIDYFNPINKIRHKITINNNTKKCILCNTNTTPLWRITNGKLLCNACGLKISRNKK